MKNILLVVLGGGVGSGFRYSIGLLVKRLVQTPFPLGTLLINVSGSLLIGIILGFYAKSNTENEGMKILLATGFCGGFTTFSAFAFENLNLIQSNQTGMALLYMCLSVVLGLLAVWAGLQIGKY